MLNFDNATTLKQVNQLLHESFTNWQKGNEQEHPVRLTRHGPNIALRFVPVSDQADADVVIFLEDLSHTEQHAHQLKLAALGRLTSAVAHEIRNPLGAISHAGQLIKESKGLVPPDRRLVDIVNQQSDRINLIIKSILRLGRPHMSEPLLMDLDDWLGKFRTNFVQTHGCGADKLTLNPTKLEVYMDPDHLHQVLTNLCENAIRHGDAYNGNGGATQVLMSGGRIDKDGTPFLDVVNDGPEIPPELEDKIFEPFFTTDGNGTGLGLYLARELCQDNNAQLDYIKTTEGSRFRIKFNRVSNVSA